MTDLMSVSWLDLQKKRLENYLTTLLSNNMPHPSGQILQESMAYAVLGGGKRFRAMLVYAVGESLSIDLNQLDSSAAAIELIHAYSLVHDDLPAMDDDVLRRGKPTCHVKFGEATAILAGDALQALAFEVLSTNSFVSAQAKVAQMTCLSKASGWMGMVLGQVLDMSFTGDFQDKSVLSEKDLMCMHRAKTGALIAAAVQLGFTPKEIDGLSASIRTLFCRLGEHLGLLFQMVDDVLDVSLDTQTLGKTQGKDEAQGKLTYVTTLGLEKTQMRIDEEKKSIREILLAIENEGFQIKTLRYLLDVTLGI
jgi:farnesyl diphosphate synthase